MNSYVGNSPTTGHFPTDTFTSSGGNTYTLSQAPATTGSIEVSVQGVLQAVSAYSISGTTLTLAGVTSGDVIFVRHLGETLQVPTPGDDTVTTTKIADDAVTTAKIADNAITAAKIGVDVIVAEDIAANAITVSELQNNAVTTAKIIDDAVTTAKILDANVTTAKVADGAITAAKIADGTVVAAEIASNAVTTAKILDANVTTAKLAADAVDGTKLADNAVGNEHLEDDAVGVAELSATGTASSSTFLRGDNAWASAAYDDTSIKADILKLAISQAVDGNRVAFNLTDSFIDGFEDDTGITTETNVDRNTSGEYVSSVATTTADSNYVLILESDSFNNNTVFTDQSANGHTITRTNAVHSTTVKKIGATSIYFANNGKLLLPDHSDFNFGTGNATIEFWVHSSDTGSPACRIIGAGSHPTEWFIRSDSTETEAVKVNIGGTIIRSSVSPNAWATGAWHHVAYVRDGEYFRVYVDGVQKDNDFGGTGSWNVSSGQRLALGVGNDAGSGEFFTGYLDGIRISKGVCRYPSGTTFTPYTTNFGSTTNATGTLISDAQTASSSRTSCSGVIIYENAAGTNTLGTDLKIYFTCNNGTNWTEASSYGTATTYSGTKKLVKLGATTCTAGTAIAMKAVWANQAASGATQVAQNTGTAIGDMTIQGGLAGAFDGVYPGGYTQAAGINANVGHIGKDWGSGNTKTITGIKYWTPNGTNGTFIAGGGTVSVRLEGSSDNSTWVNLGQEIIGNIPTTQYSRMSGFTQTAYRYHRMRVEYVGGGGSRADIAELQFFVSDGAGKEGRLHGWAVNY